MSPAEHREWRFYAESLIHQAIGESDWDADFEGVGDNEPSLVSQSAGRTRLFVASALTRAATCQTERGHKRS
jgi:hypothetical protein